MRDCKRPARLAIEVGQGVHMRPLGDGYGWLFASWQSSVVQEQLVVVKDYPVHVKVQCSMFKIQYYLLLPVQGKVHRAGIYTYHADAFVALALFGFEFARFGQQRLTHENVFLCKTTPTVPNGPTGRWTQIRSIWERSKDLGFYFERWLSFFKTQ